MDNVEALPPFPEGWYFITSRSSLQKKKLIRKTWMGEEIIAWCDTEGQICVADAICPHMGSDLGPEVGTRVRNGCLVCPFHGFEYDISGQCVATPYAPAPKTARLKTYETKEILGLVFAWWGVGGRLPQWHLPDEPPTGPDWSELALGFFRFTGHPQETAENSVDLAHLRYIHGYDNVHPVGEVSVDGAHLVSCFDFIRNRKFAGLIDNIYDVSAVTHLYGVGYSYVEIYEKTIGMDARLWVLSTPIDGTHNELVLVSQVRELRKPKRAIVGLRFIPMWLRHRIMNRIMLRAQKQDVAQDVIIWGKKQYWPRPRLSRSDGDIMAYRRYCRQFYPELYPEAVRGKVRLSSAGG